jgi:hypothetical protein
MGDTYMLTGQNKNVPKTGKQNTSATISVGGLFNARSLRHMGIFGNKKSAKELPPLFSEAEIDGASYDQVLDFLVSINSDDYKKVIKVADLYRKTHCDVAKVTGLEQQAVPSIFEEQSQPAIVAPGTPAPTDTEAGNFLDDDDDIAAAFLADDDEPATATAPVGSPTGKSTKVEIKTDDGPVAS